jgi:hypothetical protein
MHYSLIACTVFCLRPFMMAVSTNYGTAGDENLTSSGGNGSRSRTNNGYGSKSGTGNQSYAMKSMTRSFRKGGGDISMLSNAPAGGDRLDEYLHTETRQNATVSATVGASRRKHTGHDGSSVGSNESTKMIIRKDVHYAVQYQPRKSDGDDPDLRGYVANAGYE